MCCVTVKKLPNLSGPFLYLEKGLIGEILLTLGLSIKQPVTVLVLGPMLGGALG